MLKQRNIIHQCRILMLRWIKATFVWSCSTTKQAKWYWAALISCQRRQDNLKGQTLQHRGQAFLHQIFTGSISYLPINQGIINSASATKKRRPFNIHPHKNDQAHQCRPQKGNEVPAGIYLLWGSQRKFLEVTAKGVLGVEIAPISCGKRVGSCFLTKNDKIDLEKQNKLNQVDPHTENYFSAKHLDRTFCALPLHLNPFMKQKTEAEKTNSWVYFHIRKREWNNRNEGISH